MKKKLFKFLAVFLAFTIIGEIVFPTVSYALTSGPSQPEVQSFEPVGTSEMVDLFSGDFQYNIPLLDVDGYPVNISYHSGITMDQEASWVGLGWNINPGVVNRNMRGIPDDFKGDRVRKEFHMKKNMTIGLKAQASIEIFGKNPNKPKVPTDPMPANTNQLGSLSYSIAVKFNNYNGIGFEHGLNPSLSIGPATGPSLNAGLGITSSSDDGISLAPSISMSMKVNKKEKTADHTTIGVSASSVYNSRSGLKALTFGGSLSRSKSFGSTVGKGSTKGYSSSTMLANPGTSWSFGTESYTPQITMPMTSFSMTGMFTLGGEALGTHPDMMYSAYYTEQGLSYDTISNAAYGYINAEAGHGDPKALMDVNREKDGGVSDKTPSLAVPVNTFDMYGVSGQGVGGSYRPFRSDLGYVYDPEVSNTSTSVSIGAEIGFAAGFHAGFDATVVSANSKTGPWIANNDAAVKLPYISRTADTLYERYYFKEANEKTVNTDPSFNLKTGGNKPTYFQVDNSAGKYPQLTAKLVNESGDETLMNQGNYRTKRESRNQNISILSRKQLDTAGIVVNPDLFNAPKHHIAEITSLGTDGKRFVYGIAAYNTTQEEVSFAVGTKYTGNDELFSPNDVNVCKSGLVHYNDNDDTKTNNWGSDNYYSNTIMPPYAHSYLLTSILSPDYIDNAEPRGPSDNDYGTYTKFEYEKTQSNFKWRTPLASQTNMANHNEGLKIDRHDDKASYVYGEKEIWYLKKIETKNYLAEFVLEDRDDGLGVTGKNGAIDNTKRLKLLRKITLYAKTNPNVIIKEVHFVYDYSLCKKLPNTIDVNHTTGKLTLKEIYFTYGGSNRGRFSPYVFNYHADQTGENPDYDMKASDRWGNYKPNQVTACGDLLNSEFPYVKQPKTQLEKDAANKNAAVWNLKEITMPSGGKITVDYESDDYKTVQDKPAMQMMEITSAGGLASKFLDNNSELHFTPVPNTNPSDYAKTGDLLFFRCLVDFSDGTDENGPFEYVSGYAEVKDEITFINNGTEGVIHLKPAKLSNDHSAVNPIVKAAIQFGRKYLPEVVYSTSGFNQGDEPEFGLEVLKKLVASYTNFGEMFSNPNNVIYDKDYCQNIKLGKSWIRLKNPTGKKLGGGCRVKQLLFKDQWSMMTGLVESDHSYGQNYEYILDDGTSSGVAAYEPMIGNDENPWHMPVYGNIENALGPDEEFYLEEPFGEMLFPGAGVGYSRVSVTDYKPVVAGKAIKRHGTGKTVNEFFTARDFPTIAERTSIWPKEPRKRPSKASLRSFFKIDSYDYLTVSQGYMVEINDMHGKPKAVSAYQEGQEKPISRTEYIYKKKPYKLDSFRLDNTVTVIDEKGNKKEQEVGVFSDFVADMRSSRSNTQSGTLSFNYDLFIVGVLPAQSFMVWPGYSSEETLFRSAVTMKAIQRFGLLEEIRKTDLGATASTFNLAYDAVTGEVLATKTEAEFNDPIYSLTVPAHWYYDGMGTASRNIGVSMNVNVLDGIAKVNKAKDYFVEGDEVLITEFASKPRSYIAWITEVGIDQVTMMESHGAKINSTSGASSKKFSLQVIRSGRRNLQTTPIATITSLSNPLDDIRNNNFKKVLTAQSIEYGDAWRTYCGCTNATLNHSDNPYVNGTRGSWKPLTTYSYLTSRSQTDVNENTNIRNDGTFTSFSPFYRIEGGKWITDDRNWTYVTKVTEFSPSGQELENKDALGIYSSATYGYNGTMATSVGHNAKYKELAFDGYEDYNSNCADSHFKTDLSASAQNVQDFAHSGRKSLKVDNTGAVYSKQLSVTCPDPNCNISFTQTVNQVDISGGTSPYSINWSVETGAPVVSLIDENSIYVSGTAWNVNVIVVDAKGCKKVQSFIKTTP